jgi:Protein of unknown function (DUF3500)
VVDDEVRSVTPCFLGAEPATAPGLGGGTLRPLERVEDLARELVRSLSPELRDVAVLLDRPPSDIVGGNRPRVADGDQMLLLPDIWRGRVTEPWLRDRVEAMTAAAEAATGYGPEEHRRLALTSRPRGVPGSALDAGQRELLAALLSAYRGRVLDGLAAPVDLEQVHLAWAGSLEPGEPHYYRLQGLRLLT